MRCPKKHFPYGKYVLITGGTSGIGLSCARKFASYGYSVYAVSRSAGERSEKCGDGLISYKKCDVSDLDSIKALYKETGSVGTVCTLRRLWYSGKRRGYTGIGRRAPN